MTTLPHEKKAIDYHWIFKTKLKVDGSMDKKKARLVVNGNRQRNGIDYEETFALVAKNGLKVCKNDQGIFISQKKYTTDLLKENGVLNEKLYKLPMDQHVKHQADIDLTYTVQLLSQFMQNPTSVHMQAVKHLLRYLLSAHGQGILLAKSSTVHLTAYCNSDWASCPMTRRTEAEYSAMALTCCEVTWLVTLIKNLGIKDLGLVDLKCDNQASVHISTNPVFHARTEHI
ncbi:cysteine-rich receptor-like protein kinase 8 [Tanacetum coccineum]